MSVIDARHLDGVSETALLTLYQRASEAARPDGIIEDPMAIDLLAALDYDYQHFGRTHQATALRALVFDAVSRDYLAARPRATVVALAEGLQTSFWRLDNSELTWMSVDLEPVVQLRRQLLPACDRLAHCAQSALEYSWMDLVDHSNGVLITAEGLFQYLDQDTVFHLISACAKQFPQGRLVFDSIPRFISSYSRRRGFKLSKDYTSPAMPFWFTADRYDELRSLPGIRAVRELPYPSGRGKLVPWINRQSYRVPGLARFRAPVTLIEFC
jgi:O-methyltransferase involved in polyketide biosynthesis